MMLLVTYTLFYATVLLIAAIGGCISEKSGVTNLGLEGMMVIGALSGALAMKAFSGQSSVVLIPGTVAAAALGGVAMSFLLSVPAVSFKADQTLVGTAVNILSTALATVCVKSYNLDLIGKAVPSISYIEEKKAFLLDAGFFRTDVFLILALLILFLSRAMFEKTRFGLRLSACGENPLAAASAGVNVRRMRYISVAISGALAGIAGIAYITASVSEWQFDKGVAGFGFLALAVMIFGQWDPVKIAFAAIIFGFFRALSNVYSGIDLLAGLGIPGAVYNMLPYVISLVILIAFSGKSRAPKSTGIPY